MRRQSIRVRCRANAWTDTMSNGRLAKPTNPVCHSKFFRLNFTFFSGITVFVNVGRQFQSMLGFGGAFTDAAGVNVNILSTNARINLLESYYGNNSMPEHRMINKFSIYCQEYNIQWFACRWLVVVVMLARPLAAWWCNQDERRWMHISIGVIDEDCIGIAKRPRHWYIVYPLIQVQPCRSSRWRISFRLLLMMRCPARI